ncbi:MAG: hypothetical protein ACI4JM_00215 [Oscillospiraceae bacterium]
MSEENELIKNDDTENNQKQIIIDEEYSDEKKDKLNDIVITQCIICLIIAVGVLLLNIFNPELCRELIEKYKYYSGHSENDKLNEAVINAAETFINTIIR